MTLLADRAACFEKRPHLFIAALGPTAQTRAFEWLQALRLHKVRTEMDLQDRSLKAQMRRADKLGASYVLIVGDQELEKEAAVLRDMKTKSQERVPMQDLVSSVVNRIKTEATA
jgi:histidyl-tRNA synthetase